MTSKTFMLRHVKAPIIAAPMFIVSTPKMVVNQCKAGIIGSFPALNARNEKKESTLNDWLVNIKSSLDNDDIECPLYAVNQIVHKSNDRLMEDMETIVRHEVPIVITSLGAKEEINEAVHSYGGVVLHDVTNNKHARKAYEKMVIDSTSEDIVNTNMFTGIHGNYLSKSIEKAGMKISDVIANKDTKNSKDVFSSGNNKPKAWSNIYGCGQGISNVKSVEDTVFMVNKIINEYNETRGISC